jgi:hypothetical protein
MRERLDWGYLPRCRRDQMHRVELWPLHRVELWPRGPQSVELQITIAKNADHFAAQVRGVFFATKPAGGVARVTHSSTVGARAEMWHRDFRSSQTRLPHFRGNFGIAILN